MTNAATLDRIESFLRSKGWVTTRIEGSTVRSSFRGGRGNYPLVAQVEDGWIKLIVLPLARLPSEASKAERLFRQLLIWNGEIMLARFSLDDDGDVLLSVEFPVDDLDDSELADALDVLTFYADKHHPEIKSIVA